MPALATEPPELLQLAAHPLRWQLLTRLAGSDHRVRELVAMVDQPQNLVSYHLRKLRDGELVAARRSTFDGRDAYYRVDLTRLGGGFAASGAALHPGLRLAALPPRPAATRVLFLCTGNSARSQMAEALTRVRSGGLVDARSAGTHPKPLHPDAVRVMWELYDIDLSGHRPKHLDELAGEAFDHVITLCDRVREACPAFPGHPETAHWSTPDPSASGDAGAFESAAAELSVRVGFLLAALTPSDEPEEMP